MELLFGKPEHELMKKQRQKMGRLTSQEPVQMERKQ